MNTSRVAAFGSWKSPITSDLIVSKTIGIDNLAIDRHNIYWLEKRPQEKGRSLIVGYFTDGSTQDITPEAFSVRSKIHEYGGGAYTIKENTIYFSNYADGRIYRQVVANQAEPLTEKAQKRYGDIIIDSDRNRLICVCEDHSLKDVEPQNSIISIDLSSGRVQTLIEGSDFYSSPRLSPDGRYLAWTSWDHPNMPWDSTYLWLAEVDCLGTSQPQLVAGGKTESICEPKWGNDGTLYFNSDRTNWWNIYRRNSDGTVEILHEMAAEFAYPHWVFGLSTYAVGSDRLTCAYSMNGSWNLGTIDLHTQEFQEIKTRYTNISSLQAVDNIVVFIGGSPTETTAVVRLDLETGKEKILKRAGDLTIDPDYLSLPEAIAFPTTDNLTAYAWYYPPQNKDYIAPTSELPPLVVKSHGGSYRSSFGGFEFADSVLD